MTVRMDMGAARREREEEQRRDYDPEIIDHDNRPARDNGRVGKPTTLRALDFVWADDIEPKIAEPGLVDRVLGLVGVAVAYGESTVGKTFVIVELACCIAALRLWRGLDIEPGVVVYIAAEAPSRSSAGSGPGNGITTSIMSRSWWCDRRSTS